MTHHAGRAPTSLSFSARSLRLTAIALIGIGTAVSTSPMSGRVSARTRDLSSAELLLEAEARPVSLAAADFDADGVPDLLAGYATGEGGKLVLHRGNVDALYPHTPEARARKLAGQFTAAPFLPGTRTFAVPAAPDFLHTGDFDADGHFDALAATSGGAAVVLRGDGRGVLGTAEPIALPGTVTSMAVGDINGPDGRADVVIGITGDAGSRLLVFAGYDGAWTATPAVFDLPAPATALALGRADDVHVADIAATVGDEQLVFHGREERRRSSRLRPAPQPSTPLTVPDAVAVLPMRLDLDAHDDLVILRPGATAPTVVTTLAATTRVVTNTNDSGPGSLRQAILDANADMEDDLITFDIPGPGPHTIMPVTDLPAIVPVGPDLLGSTIIDGTSEPDFAGTPIVELSGVLLGPGSVGLTVSGPGCVVRGLAINRFTTGIFFTSEPRGAPDIGFVEGNYIGTDITGAIDLGNEVGVQLGFGIVAFASRIAVGGTAPAARNVISGNVRGIHLSGGPHVIQGNYVGTDASGVLPLGNSGPGISFSSAGLIDVGGLQPGAGNVISANGGPGVTFSESGAILIAGNFIGTDASGERALGNGSHGIDAPDSGMTITGNLISANAGLGISAPSILATLDILDNFIGTNKAGTSALGNGQSGVEVNGNLRTIRGNLISGNGEHGVMLRGLENFLQQNRIGTDVTGTLALGNRGAGVQVLDVAHTIGGEGNGNVIAFNGGRGIVTLPDLFSTIGILSNSIHSNGGLGIDLWDDGVTANDTCDADQAEQSGTPNRPVLSSVTSSSSGTTITGQLNSLPDKVFVVQFFSSPAPDPSGFGEGKVLLGSSTVTTDAACNAGFTVTFPVPLAANHVVTATATTDFEFGRITTSEFSNALSFVPQTSEEAIRALIAQVRDLVALGELNGIAGFVLTIKLQAALFFVERDMPRVAAVQLLGFIQVVELLVKVGQLDPVHGLALADAARAVLAGPGTVDVV